MAETLEREVEKALIKGVGKLGGHSYKIASTGTAGMPDRMNLFPGSHVDFVELKKIDGDTSKLQRTLHKMFLRVGSPVTILDTKDKVNNYLKFWENKLKKEKEQWTI